jgi:hypothetical protein
VRALPILVVLFASSSCTKDTRSTPTTAPAATNESADEDALDEEEDRTDELRAGTARPVPPAYSDPADLVIVAAHPRCSSVTMHVDRLIAASPYADQAPPSDDQSQAKFCLTLNRARYDCVLDAGDLDAMTKCLKKAGDVQCEAQAAHFHDLLSAHYRAEAKKPISRSATRTHILALCTAHDTNADHACKWNAKTYEAFYDCEKSDW